MTTQKTFKSRVRARAAKTGESYAAARAHLLPRQPAAPAIDEAAVAATGLNDELVRRSTGRSIGDWLRILDAWGARDRTHRDIARWLVDDQGVPGWWAQSVTVGYERARGMRAMHEVRDGFSVSATRTIRATAEAVTDAFTDVDVRSRWLPDAPMRSRRSTRGKSARFDWDEPASRIVVEVTARAAGRVQVAVAHEKVPDAAAAARLKAMWRERLLALRELLQTER